MKFNLFHANVKSNPRMPQDKVIHDVVTIRKFGRNGGFNEIQPARYKRAVNAAYKKSYNSSTESPQVVNPRLFKVINAYTVKMHGGFASMTPTRSVSVLETLSRDGLPVAFIESHYINKGMHKSLLQRNPAFRKKLHDRHWVKEAEIVAGLLTRGYTIFGGEDANEHHMPKYVANQQWIHNTGIDKMWYVPAEDVRVEILKKGKISTKVLFTDHPALTARISITKD